MAIAAVLVLAGCDQKPGPEFPANSSGTGSTTTQAATLPQPPATERQPGPGPLVGDPYKNPDMTALAAQVDADGDGRMSEAEWNAQGLPVSSFKMFEKGRGYVTLQDYRANAAPPGIDGDGDGKVTIAEFKAFDRKMSAIPPGGPGPGPRQ